MFKFVTASLVSLFCFSAIAAKSIPAGTYTIDTAHSKIGFEVAHLVIASVEGRFVNFDGSINVDKQLDKSKVSLNIDTASINTDNAKRDDHLRSPDFFDTAKNPKITFVAKKITGKAENFKMTGDLTMKGVTKEVTLNSKFLGDVNDPFGNHKIAFVANGKINRKDFGLTWNNIAEAGPVVGDEITLSIKLEANQPIEKK